MVIKFNANSCILFKSSLTVETFGRLRLNHRKFVNDYCKDSFPDEST